MIRTKIPQLETYLRRILSVSTIEILQIPREDTRAEVSVGDVNVGIIFVDEDGDYQMEVPLKAATMEDLSRQLKDTLLLSDFELRRQHNKSDMAEIYIGEEFVGPVYLDEGGKGQFQVPILQEDLEPA